ncbi:MAG: GNAT family N-acetyltransferase [Selenomonadaceae bacterium]|nr:GNAT family N-acetyltransferase [Selenomonadaceae bacterium]
MEKISLVPIKNSEKENFIVNIQKSFKKAFVEEFGDCDEEIISREEIINSFNSPYAVTYNIFCENKIVGGIILEIHENNLNEISLFFVNVDCHSKGIGQAAWREIEKIYPNTKIWETVTPYFEKRNIHFYVNKLGFHIVEFYNPKNPDPNEVDMPGGEYFFRFEKVMGK